MRILGEWRRRLHYIFHRRQIEEELQREMQTHREMMGEPQRFGNSLRLREESRDVWGWNWLDNLWKDLRYGLRQLRKVPAFTLLAVVTLAVGIGAITTMSGLLRGLLYAELPVHNPGELRQMQWSLRVSPGSADRDFSYPVYKYTQANTTSFSDVVCWSNPTSVTLGAGEYPERATAQFVSGNVFRAVGVEMALGRPISPEDDQAGAAPVAILSYGAWQRLFGGEGSVLGRKVNVNGSPFVIIGVIASREFQNTPTGRWTADLTIPVSQSANNETSCRIIGRLRPGMSEQQAERESEELVRQAFLAYPPARNGKPLDEGRMAHVALRGLRGIDQMDSFGAEILAFVLLIGALLAIVCSNIAGMMLARGVARRSEIATRLAIGAGRMRLVRQLLTESILLAGIGGGVGVGLCYIVWSFIPWPFVLDLPVLAITAGFSCATGLLFGLAPALLATRLDLTSVMKHASPGSLGSTFRTGFILVAVQVTLSLLLLVAAGLQIRSLMRMVVPSSFEPERVLTVEAHPRLSGYTQERVPVYFEEAVRRLKGLPGIAAAAASSSNGFSSLVRTPSGSQVAAIADYVSPGFFETMKISVRLGRDFAWTDRKGAPAVAIVNEAFVRTLDPGTSPLGQTLQLQRTQAEIVGVVEDSNNSVGDAFGMGQSAQPSIYLPFQQQAGILWGSMTVSARVTGDPAALVSVIRSSMRDIDPGVVVDPVMTQASKGSGQIQERRAVVGILVLAGLIALLEVSFGIYGTLSFFVSRRTPEIGLRVALGAQRADVIRMVLRQSMLPVTIGALAGLAGAPILTRLLESGRFLVGNIHAGDQLAIIGAALLCLLIALAAAGAPARRASRIAPMQALRHE